MIGVVLGLGFQWVPSLTYPWQYIAFAVAYLEIIDYWIEYSPSLKKWPPKKEIDLILDVSIVFSLFLYIYSTQLTIYHFLGAGILIRLLDYFWIFSSKIEFNPTGLDKTYMNTWLKLNLILASGSAIALGLGYYLNIAPLNILFIYIGIKLFIRILASLHYKKIHYT